MVEMREKVVHVIKRIGYIAVTILLLIALMASFYREETAYALRWNPIATIVFAVLAIVLALTEKKFGYYSWIWQGIRNWISSAREIKKEEKAWKFFLHLSSAAVTLVTVLMIGSFIWFEIFLRATIILSFAATFVSVALQLTDRIILGRGAEFAKLFLVIALLAGLMFSYTEPPALYVSWDDCVHFDCVLDWVHIFDQEMTYAESQIFTYRGHPGLPGYMYTEQPHTYLQEILQGSNVAVSNTSDIRGLYSSIGYSPMILVVGLLSLLGSDIIKFLVLSRLANVLVYSFIIYRGIRKLKRGAMIFSVVCLLPTAFFLACTHNYDFWLTAWFAYSFATLFAALQRTDRKLCPSDLWRVLLGLFLACGPKALYCAMIFPLLFIGKDNYENPAHAKRFRIWTLLTVGVILVTLVAPALGNPDIYTDHRFANNGHISTGEQISFILSNPFEYAKMLLSFLLDYLSFYMMNTHSVFYLFLGLSHTIFGTAITFLLLYCVFTDRTKDDGYEKMQKLRWFTIFFCFAQIALVATSMYVGVTPVGQETIDGCQFRYLFPLMLPFCFFLTPKKIYCEISPKFQAVVVYGGLALVLLGSYFNAYLTQFLL